MLVPHGFCSLNLYVLLVKSGLIGEIQIVGETYIAFSLVDSPGFVG